MTGFRRVSERRVFTGHVFSVDVVGIEGPGGEQFDREVVEHPGAVSVVPAGGDGTVTLVRQVRAAVSEAVLEAPAGTCDVDGEDAEATARRELAEEVGLRADRLERLGTVLNSPGYSSQRSVIFLATGLTGCDRGPSGPEERWMSTESVHLSDVERLVEQGRLMDATTIAGLLLARDRLGRRPS